MKKIGCCVRTEDRVVVRKVAEMTCVVSELMEGKVLLKNKCTNKKCVNRGSSGPRRDPWGRPVFGGGGGRRCCPFQRTGCA